MLANHCLNIASKIYICWIHLLLCGFSNLFKCIIELWGFNESSFMKMLFSTFYHISWILPQSQNISKKFFLFFFCWPLPKWTRAILSCSSSKVGSERLIRPIWAWHRMSQWEQRSVDCQAVGEDMTFDFHTEHLHAVSSVIKSSNSQFQLGLDYTRQSGQRHHSLIFLNQCLKSLLMLSLYCLSVHIPLALVKPVIEYLFGRHSFDMQLV